MISTLDDPTLPEYVKAKQYAQNLSQFLHIERKLIDPKVLTQIVEPEKIVKTPTKKKMKKPQTATRLKRKHIKRNLKSNEDIKLSEIEEMS